MTISNCDGLIDSRDITERIGELEIELESAHEDEGTEKEFDEWLTDMAGSSDGTFQEPAQELIDLRAFAEEAKGYAGDWLYGVSLIREEYFTEYCQELLADIGDLPRDLPGYIVIDWEATADNLKVDYTSVDFAGEEYLVR